MDVVKPVLDVGIANQAAEQRQRRLDPVDDELVERAAQAHQRFGARAAVDDQLADQRIVVRRDRIALVDRGIDAHAKRRRADGNRRPFPATAGRSRGSRH